MVKKVEAQVTGVARVLKRFDLSKKGAFNGITIGLTKAAIHLLRKSVAIVPVDTGVLKASARTSPVKGKGTSKQSTSVAYHGTDYGIYVHEDPSKAHAQGKTYKFLERPAKEERKAMLDLIASGVSEGIKKAL